MPNLIPAMAMTGPVPSFWPASPRLVTSLLLCFALLGCATAPPPTDESQKKREGWLIGSPPAPNPGVKRAIIARANQEWTFFGRQTVILKGSEESIPHVGAWEDDDGPYSGRINEYWRAAGKPRLNGRDCREPWSAAFMTWVMREAGVPEMEFPSASAHWVYLARLISRSDYPGRYFVPRRILDYSPNPGDLICSSRGPYRLATYHGYISPEDLKGANTHCDLVVEKDGQSLEVIGGNVRNSVSKTTLELDSAGHLQEVPRRPWFLILQNRL